MEVNSFPCVNISLPRRPHLKVAAQNLPLLSKRQLFGRLTLLEEQKN